MNTFPIPLTLVIITSSLFSVMFPDEQLIASTKNFSPSHLASGAVLGPTMITVHTDENTYATDSNIKIFGQVLGGNLTQQHVVIIRVDKTRFATLGNPVLGLDNALQTPEIAAVVPATSVKGSGQYNVTTSVQDGGQYRVTASIADDQNHSQSAGGNLQRPFTTFEAAPMFLTVPFILLYVAIAFFIALLATIASSAPKDPRETKTGQSDKSEKRDSRDYLHNMMHFKRPTANREMLRFIFISGILASIIGSLVFSDVQVGVNAPIGLVRQGAISGKAQTGNQTTGEWVVNVGGVQNPLTLSYVGGIQIPATVVIFGLLGGYLRYLYGLRYIYTSKKPSQDQKDVDLTWGDIDLSDPLWFFKHALRSLSIIFLAPLLAVGVWFIVFQGNFEGKFAIAAISLAIGLITEEAVQAIIAFARNILSGIKGTVPGAETRALKVISKFPVPDGPRMTADPPPLITATFSDVVDMKTVDHLSFYIRDIDRKDPEGEKGYSLSDDARTIKYSIPKLANSKTYIVTITTEVKDIHGYSLAAPEVWSFMTESVPSITQLTTTPPTIGAPIQ